MRPTVAQASSQPDPVTRERLSLEKRFTWTVLKERLILCLLFVCAVASIATTLGIIYVLLSEAVYSPGEEQAFFEEVSVVEFFTGTKWTPEFSDKHFGVLPLLVGTLLVAGIAALIGLPIGLTSSLYLSEYATPRIRNIVKPMLEILAGIPTVVYGYFALVFITPYALKPLEGIGLDVLVAECRQCGNRRRDHDHPDGLLAE